MAEPIFGIDLGTTFSCIAGFDEVGKCIVYRNEDGATFTPSVIVMTLLTGAQAAE